MNKDNIFRSSEFHMDTGDVLHMVIDDETGTFVTMGLYTSETGLVEGSDIESVSDIDGNTYFVVTIGTQKWMTSNLRTTRYADGTPIPNLTLDADWIAEDGSGGHDGAYCLYNNDSSYRADYGLLYNWHAVNNVHGLAPTGWRVPTNADLTTLYTYLGGDTVTGGKLKEIGTSHWTSPNTGATNEAGFNLLPAGLRDSSGLFSNVLVLTHLWSSTAFGASAYDRYVYYNSAAFTNGIHNKKYGFSVRCVKDV